MAWSGCYSEREGKRRRKGRRPRAITAREGGPSWPGGWKVVAAARWICVRALANRLVLVRPRSEALQCRVEFGGGSWRACGGGCWVFVTSIQPDRDGCKGGCLAAARSARRGMARRCASWQPCRGREGRRLLHGHPHQYQREGVEWRCAGEHRVRGEKWMEAAVLLLCSVLVEARRGRRLGGRWIQIRKTGSRRRCRHGLRGGEREEHPAHIAQSQASGPYRSSPKEAETDHPPPPPPPQWAGRLETAAREAARASLQGGGRAGDSRTSRSGGHVAAAAVSPTPAPAAADGGAVPFPVGERRAGMLLRVRAGGEEGKDGALAGLLTSFFLIVDSSVFSLRLPPEVVTGRCACGFGAGAGDGGQVPNARQGWRRRQWLRQPQALKVRPPRQA
jgi:hypothetical protein